MVDNENPQKIDPFEQAAIDGEPMVNGDFVDEPEEGMAETAEAHRIKSLPFIGEPLEESFSGLIDISQDKSIIKKLSYFFVKS